MGSKREMSSSEASAKMKVKAAMVITLILVFNLANFAGLCVSALQEGFYRGKCGVADVELIVAGVVTTRFFMDPTIVAALLRLQFHDCFVNVSCCLDLCIFIFTNPKGVSVYATFLPCKTLEARIKIL